MLEIRPTQLQAYFEVDFSLYCHYAREPILEGLYRVMASAPFNTG